jgi:lysozyme
MLNNLKTDAAGRAFITLEEGEKLLAYKCTAGKDTIGVGHTGPDVKPKMAITTEQSQQLLTKDLARFEAAVNKMVTVPLTQCQFNALVSFAFNLGEGSLKRSSLLKLINAKGIVAEHHFEAWCNVNGTPSSGIKARRLREAKLFLGH